jgi:hypothetical protein
LTVSNAAKPPDAGNMDCAAKGFLLLILLLLLGRRAPQRVTSPYPTVHHLPQSAIRRNAKKAKA